MFRKVFLWYLTWKYFWKIGTLAKGLKRDGPSIQILHWKSVIFDVVLNILNSLFLRVGQPTIMVYVVYMVKVNISELFHSYPRYMLKHKLHPHLSNSPHSCSVTSFGHVISDTAITTDCHFYYSPYYLEEKCARGICLLQHKYMVTLNFIQKFKVHEKA